jgi:hypothetical protein
MAGCVTEMLTITESAELLNRKLNQSIRRTASNSLGVMAERLRNTADAGKKKPARSTGSITWQSSVGEG